MTMKATHACLSIVALLFVVPDCLADSLVTNGQFTTELAPWSGGNSSFGEWSSVDIDDSPNSGSFHMFTGSPGSSRWILQCIFTGILPGDEVRVSGYGHMTLLQDDANYVFLRLSFRDAEDCGGSILADVFTDRSGGQAFGDWFLMEAEGTAPAGKRSARSWVSSSPPELARAFQPGGSMMSLSSSCPSRPPPLSR